MVDENSAQRNRPFFRLIHERAVSAWRQSVKRKLFATSKFYLFDPGVVRRLPGGGEVRPGTAEFGLAVETLACHELRFFCE